MEDPVVILYRSPSLGTRDQKNLAAARSGDRAMPTDREPPGAEFGLVGIQIPGGADQQGRSDR